MMLKFIDTVVHRLIIIVKLLFNFAPADIGLREEVKDPGKERETSELGWCACNIVVLYSN